MEQKDAIRAELRESKKEVFQRILTGIQEAIEKDEENYYIADLIILGDKMTFHLQKSDWHTVLEKGRVFFESIEDYDSCRICRDLKKKIS